MLIILFGLSGSGKNFVGELLAKEASFHFWDADQVLPDSMRLAIKKKMPITQAMRDELTLEMITEINKLSKSHTNLVVAQALYKKKNRDMLVAAFPEVHLVCVQAPSIIINERLDARHVGVRQDYASLLLANFELPDSGCPIVKNDGDQNSLSYQLKALLSQFLLHPN